MSQTFHKKANGATVVKKQGKIVTNLPSPQSYQAPTAATVVPGLPVNEGDVSPEVQRQMFARLTERREHAAETDVRLAELDRQIEALRAIPVDESEPVEGDTGQWTAKAKTEAIDAVRLVKANAREEATVHRIAKEVAGGFHRLTDYGVGPLGTAEAIGTFETNSEAWLLARTEGIGGSDKIGYVNAENKFIAYDSSYLRSTMQSKTPEAVKKIKADAAARANGTMDAEVPSLPIQIGNALERTIQYEFAIGGIEYDHFEDKSSRVAAGRPHHRFNPDGVLRDQGTGDFGVFEAKTSRDAATYEKALPGYKAQCLHNAAAADLPFAVLVADVEGEHGQRVLRMDFSAEERAEYRRLLDRVWFVHKPEFDRRLGQFR